MANPASPAMFSPAASGIWLNSRSRSQWAHGRSARSGSSSQRSSKASSAGSIARASSSSHAWFASAISAACGRMSHLRVTMLSDLASRWKSTRWAVEKLQLAAILAFATDSPMVFASQAILNGVNQYPLLAIPAFILAGVLLGLLAMLALITMVPQISLWLPSLMK